MTQVTAVQPRDDYLLYVEFSDGKRGLFDMKPYLNMPVFRELKDIACFRKARVGFGTVTWPDERDIAPETIYAELQDAPASPVEQADCDRRVTL